MASKTTKTMSFRAPNELIRRVKEIARSKGWTPTYWLRRAAFVYAGMKADGTPRAKRERRGLSGSPPSGIILSWSRQRDVRDTENDKKR